MITIYLIHLIGFEIEDFTRVQRFDPDTYARMLRNLNNYARAQRSERSTENVKVIGNEKSNPPNELIADDIGEMEVPAFTQGSHER